MAIEYMGLSNIQGPLVVLEGVRDAFYEEMVTVTLQNGEKRMGRVTEISGDKAVIQVFRKPEHDPSDLIFCHKLINSG